MRYAYRARRRSLRGACRASSRTERERGQHNPRCRLGANSQIINIVVCTQVCEEPSGRPERNERSQTHGQEANARTITKRASEHCARIRRDVLARRSAHQDELLFLFRARAKASPSSERRGHRGWAGTHGEYSLTLLQVEGSAANFWLCLECLLRLPITSIAGGL